MRRVAVIGGGLSGLAVAYKILEEAAVNGLEVDLTLWESETRFGGKIGTVFRDGFRCETGPNGFLDNAPQTLELADRLGTTQSDVARMEGGNRPDPHISTIQRYAEALECAVEDLL